MAPKPPPMAVVVYSFSHLTFQEYYIAKYIDNTYGGTLDRLASHLNNPHWRDVFLLTASLLSDATALFWYIMLHLDFALDLDWTIAPDGNFDLVPDLARAHAINLDLPLILILI